MAAPKQQFVMTALAESAVLTVPNRNFVDAWGEGWGGIIALFVSLNFSSSLIDGIIQRVENVALDRWKQQYTSWLTTADADAVLKKQAEVLVEQINKACGNDHLKWKFPVMIKVASRLPNGVFEARFICAEKEIHNVEDLKDVVLLCHFIPLGRTAEPRKALKGEYFNGICSGTNLLSLMRCPKSPLETNELYVLSIGDGHEMKLVLPLVDHWQGTRFLEVAQELNGRYKGVVHFDNPCHEGDPFNVVFGGQPISGDTPNWYEKEDIAIEEFRQAWAKIKLLHQRNDLWMMYPSRSALSFFVLKRETRK